MQIQANLSQNRFSRILEGMEVHFTPEQEAQLAQLATKPGPIPSNWPRVLSLATLTKKPAFLPPLKKA